MSRLLILGLVLAGVSAAPDPADQTTNGPASAPASPDPRAADKLPSDERPPLWQVYYDRGVRAMREKKYEDAIDHFGKAIESIGNTTTSDLVQARSDILTHLGVCYTEIGVNDRIAERRNTRLSAAQQRFAQARRLVLELHGPDSLEYADATERLADAMGVHAEARDGNLRAFLPTLKPSRELGEPASDLYLLALTIREQQLGETHSETMNYRRKVLRQLRKWIRTANALRRRETDIKILYQYDPVIERFKTLADELTQRDRDLKRPDDASTNGD